MKFAFGAALLLSQIGPALAEPGIVIKNKLRFADAAADACFANCANENASCKRVWTRIRAGITEADIERAREYAERSAEAL